ncbi:MAG: hypothetical protein HY647_11265 [Acidobacteria bacterium]|nr:hypothetical protein [Acidobacteriota bacterium]
MSQVSLLATLLTIWAGLVVILVVLSIYRAILGSHEEDQLFLDQAEAALEQEQVQNLQRINRIDPVIKILAIVCGGLLLFIAAVWVYRGLYGAVIL